MLKQHQILKIKSRKLPGEQWTKLYGFYAVSNMGRWYSFKSQKILKQHKNSSGYKRVCLVLDGKNKWIFTHIKVVEIYGDSKGNRIPEGIETLREVGLSIDHLNCKRTDPRQLNLELLTHKENCQRKYTR